MMALSKETFIVRNRIGGDFKYLALYWALGFVPDESGVFVKNYGDCTISIDSEKGEALFGKPLTIIGMKALPLDTHESFVLLECVNRLLELGYNASEIIVDPKNEWDIYLDNIYIKCFEWGSQMSWEGKPMPKRGTFVSVLYQSRLYSGFVDHKELIANGDGEEYDCGVMDCRRGTCCPSKLQIREENGFKLRGNEAIAYIGNEKSVALPDGVVSIASCVFWDNQIIEEVLLPSSLLRIGGDLFYGCKNLKKLTVPKSVREMGDNPFAGCPNLKLDCLSPYFRWDGHLLYQGDRLIYCQIKDAPREITVAEGTKTIGKHVFYLCNSVDTILLPSSIKRMQNFPFSGCSVKNLIMMGGAYKNVDGVVYTGDMKEMVGCLNSTSLPVLEIPEGVEKIGRNSFFRCIGIGKVILPATLRSIGYNPFNGCANIEFESRSNCFKVIGGRLYDSGVSKLICCPKSKAVGEVHLPDSVIELERSAFSGCSEMTDIFLKNVGKIGKACFSGCSSLQNVYIPDFVSYVGEWAFSHCSSLKEVSVGPDTMLDNNCFAGSSCKDMRRPQRENYLIESENLSFLQGAADGLANKVDSIIIDPPYNSKIDYVGYQDDFGSSYLEFLKERFKTAKPLLKEDGWMVICIDRGGLKAVKCAARSIFGKKNVFVRLWKKLDKRFDCNKEKKPGKKNVLFEYIVFCKNSPKSRLNPICSPKEKMVKAPFVFSGYGTTSSAKDEIAEVFGSRNAFSTPKPLALIRELARATCPKDGLLMDFFAGSGTLGVATMALNCEDGGSRSYILVTNNESDFANRIAEPRIVDAENKYGGGHVFVH